jgi:predicted dehydrogenase
MGRLHVRAYSQMPQVRLVGVLDANAAAAEATAAEYKTRAFASIAELTAEAKAVTIATPTQFHAAAAEPCLQAGVACLIEKPLARDVAECRQILEWSQKYNTPVQVGHIERFNPAVRAVAKLDLHPRFIEAMRISPLTFRSLDVGVVLDMMIHDLDVVLKFARAPLARVEATGVSVIGGGVEDVCNARLTFENGCVANVTASRLAMKTERRLRLFGADAFVSLDYGKRTAAIARRTGNLGAIRDTVARIRAGEIADLSQVNYTNLINVEELKVEELDPLKTQLGAFVEAVQTGRPPEVTASDGLAAVDAAERIVRAMPEAGILG